MAMTPLVRGVTLASAVAHRRQWWLALLTLVPPNGLGMWALWLAFSGHAGRIEWLLFAGMYLLSTTGATIGMHRLFAHRAFSAGPLLTTWLAITGSMAAQGPLLFWAANHRRHHAYSDRLGDPHSPNLHGDTPWQRLRGLWYSHIGWMFSREISAWSVFARDLVQQRYLFRLHQTYWLWVLLGLALPTLAGGWLHYSLHGAWLGFLFGGMLRIALVNHASWAVGSVCHRWGSLPFRTHDRSRNNHLVALLSFGEGLQNNHHAFPSAARHGLRWWEPDFSGWLILLLARLGWVWNVNHPSPAAVARAREEGTA
jgi:stearoyl-CoA desaturase (delta-9 desaturase)